MRAAIFREPGIIDVDLIPVTAPGPQQVLCAVDAAGVCGSDVGVFRSGGVPNGTILGHEGVGRVVEVGEEVEGVRPGDRVVFWPAYYCGTCEHCSRGARNLCERHFTHSLGTGLANPGCWAEYVVADAYMARLVPTELAAELGILVEPTACAIHACRRAQVTEGDVALVVGGGPLGLLIAAYCRALDAEVIVCETRERRRRVASDLELGWVVDSLDAVSALVRRGDAGAPNRAFNCTSSAAATSASVQVVAPGGTLVVAGLVPTDLAIPGQDLIRRELTVVGSINCSSSDFADAVTWIASDAQRRLARLIDERVSLQELVEGAIRPQLEGSICKAMIVIAADPQGDRNGAE